MSMEPTSVIIIGGGLGGLFTGAFLGKEGLKVTILEKSHTIGGGLQCFHRGGTIFETGMHILGGFRKGHNLYRICSYLGILNKLEIKDTDLHAMDSVTYDEDGRTYVLPSGKEAFTQYLKDMFPAERKNIQAYMDALYAIAQEVDLFYLRPGGHGMPTHSEDFLMPADEFIAKYVSDRRLRDLLAYMSPMYGGVAGHTPAYIHAMINVLYIDGSSQFVDGSQQLADSLADLIKENGGEVRAGDGVEKVEVLDRKVTKVITHAGKVYTADWYVSDVHPCTLFQLTGEGAFPRHYMQRIQNIPNSYSAFTLFIKFKPGKQPYVNHPRYYQDHYGSVWQLGDFHEESFPAGFMYITPPTRQQGPLATRMVVNCLMPFDAVRQWENTRVGRRGKEYEEWKKRLETKLLDKLESLHPGFKESIKMCFSASPLTIRDYLGVKEGSLYGHLCDCKNLLASQMPIATKVRNLLLTGQNVNLHGICGVPLTAIQTAEGIVGYGKILEKINKH